MKTITTPQGKVIVDEVETLTTLYQSHLRSFIQGLSFSHNPISDNAVGRFRTWYNQNPEIAAQQKGVYTEEAIELAIEFGLQYAFDQKMTEQYQKDKLKFIQSLNQEPIP